MSKSPYEEDFSGKLPAELDPSLMFSFSLVTSLKSQLDPNRKIEELYRHSKGWPATPDPAANTPGNLLETATLGQIHRLSIHYAGKTARNRFPSFDKIFTGAEPAHP